MANPKHLALLQQGVESWNQFRSQNPKLQPDLSRADLSCFDLRGINLSGVNAIACYFGSGNLEGANLRGASLIGADLSGTYLREVDLSQANLSVAHLMGADLREAHLDGANLTRADLNRANLTRANLSEAILIHAHAIGVSFSGANLMGTDMSDASSSEANFIGANLVGANLTQTNLSGAYCSGANFSGANLTRTNLGGANLIGANLSAVKILETNLNEAICTGACIDQWCIYSSIVLSGVTCDYIYQRSYYDRGTLQYRDRLPHDTKRNFAPGEFVAFIGQAIETVDLSFDGQIEWEAFFRAFNTLQNQMRAELDGGEIALQAIEKKFDGRFAIRVEIPPEADGAFIQSQFQTLYDRALSGAIEQPLNPNIPIEGSSTSPDRNFFDFTRFFASQGDCQPIDTPENSAKFSPLPPPKPSHAERGDIAQNREIVERDRLLQILDRVYPANVPANYRAQMEVAVGRITQDPVLKAKVTASLYRGGIASVRSLCESPYVNLLLAAYESWQGSIARDRQTL